MAAMGRALTCRLTVIATAADDVEHPNSKISAGKFRGALAALSSTYQQHLPARLPVHLPVLSPFLHKHSSILFSEMDSGTIQFF
jgi:hypothetical protein